MFFESLFKAEVFWGFFAQKTQQEILPLTNVGVFLNLFWSGP